MANKLVELGKTLLTGKTPDKRLAESIVLTEQPDLLKQTWGESRKILDGAGVDEFLTEFGVWEFTGRVGETRGKAVLKDDPQLKEYWTSENAAYHYDVMDAHSEWEKQNGGERRYMLHVNTDYSDGEDGQKVTQTKISMMPIEDEVTLEELLKATTDFRKFANDKLKSIWGGFEL